MWPLTKSAVDKKDYQCFAQQAKEKNKNTPDVALLERKLFNRVFVFDDMMKGHPGHDKFIREHSAFLATGFTAECMTLWKKKLGKLSFPVALPDTFHTTPSVPIKGELYALETSQILELDKERENGVQFIRKRINIVLPYRHLLFNKDRPQVYKGTRSEDSRELYDNIKNQLTAELRVNVTAWAYVGVSDYWSPQLDAGYLFSPVKCFAPEQKPEQKYYYYSQLEYDEQ